MRSHGPLRLNYLPVCGTLASILNSSSFVTLQDNRILAELEHPRTTGPTSTSLLMTSLGAGTTGGILSNASHYTLSGLTSTNTTTTTALGASSSLYTGLSSLTGAGGGLTGTSGGYTGTSSGAGGLISSSSSHALTGGLSLLDSLTNPVSSSSGTSSAYHHHYTTTSGSGTSAAALQNASNVSPLPIRAHQISTMPPLCQVRPNS